MNLLKRPFLYILDDNGEPVAETDVLAWSAWHADKHDRCALGRTERGGVVVSTVFLKFDHNVLGDKPVLWETLVFGGERNGTRWWYETRAEAQAGHAKACELVLGLPPGGVLGQEEP